MADGALPDSVPPHNLEAEVAALGALLLNEEALPVVLRYLRAEDFYRPAHRRVFEAIVALFNRSDPVDLITLTDELKRAETLDACGGASYISGLTTGVPTSANVEYYARIVQACSLRRRMLTLSAELSADAHAAGRDVREVIDDAERRIFDLSDQQLSGSYQSAREIVTQTVDKIEALSRAGAAYTGVPSGYPDLDRLTSGFQESEFIVIGARPSVGKTALALSMATNIAIRAEKPVPVGLFTLEMSSHAVMQRVLASEARIDSTRIRAGLLKPSDWQQITDAAGRIYDAPLYIDDTPGLRLLDLRAQARRMRARHDVGIVFIDYLTLVTSEHLDLPRHEQIAEISRSLKALARELTIPVVALSQVRRETEGRRPALADLRESGSIEQDADVVMFLHRDREPDGPQVETELMVAKQRNGPTEDIKLAFVPRYVRFESFQHGQSAA